MRLALAALSLAAATYAQGVTQYIEPKGAAPMGCKMSKDGQYELSVEPLVGKKTKRNAFAGVSLQWLAIVQLSPLTHTHSKER
jgi:hypothetical protein